MAGKAHANRLVFRPHFKTHQSHLIGQWFREEGVTKITASSLSMAAYFAEDGWDDITVAFPVNIREMDTINELARVSAVIRTSLRMPDRRPSLMSPSTVTNRSMIARC